ncbi:MAG: tetratricopeptide repeat protein, partial [Dehalococcoidia bacterium]
MCSAHCSAPTEQAEAQYAWDQAARHYEQALALLAGDSEDDAVLLTAAGRCYQYGGDLRSAWPVLSRAIEIFQARGDGIGLAHATLLALDQPVLGADPLTSYPGGETIRLPALELLGDRDLHLRARLLVPPMQGPPGASIPPERETAERTEAASLATRHGFEDVVATLHNADANDHLLALRFPERGRALEEAFRSYDRIGQAAHAGIVLVLLAGIPAMSGDLAGTERAARRLEEYAKAHGLTRYLAIASHYAVRAAVFRGDPARVPSVDDCPLPPSNADRWRWQAAAAEFALTSGDIEVALAVAREYSTPG